MKLFGKLPQEKAMSALIHDSNNALFSLLTLNSLIKGKLKDLNIDDEVLKDDVNRMDAKIERIKKVIDAYYLKFKVDFKEDA